jgi:2-keto-4-pentenoate hydratase
MSVRHDAWEDDSVRAGMDRLLARRAEVLGAGARSLGWKLAFGTEAAMAALGLNGPVVGFLTDATEIVSGGEVKVAEWTAPKIEPEIAIYLGPGGEGAAGIGAAIELADADRPPADTEEVLAGDIYHRAVLLGTPVPRPPGPIKVAVERDGERVASTENAEAIVGRLETLAAYVPEYLSHFGIATSEGEVIISGSTVPLMDIAAGEVWTSGVEAVGSLEVRII